MIADGWVKRPDGYWEQPKVKLGPNYGTEPPKPKAPKAPKPLCNKTESRWYGVMVARGYAGILAQAITLRLDPPFKSYRPDFFYIGPNGGWRFVEVKAQHRFAEKGIAKAALAAKTYPQFTFELAMWKNKQWHESVFTP